MIEYERNADKTDTLKQIAKKRGRTKDDYILYIVTK